MRKKWKAHKEILHLEGDSQHTFKKNSSLDT